MTFLWFPPKCLLLKVKWKKYDPKSFLSILLSIHLSILLSISIYSIFYPKRSMCLILFSSCLRFMNIEAKHSKTTQSIASGVCLPECESPSLPFTSYVNLANLLSLSCKMDIIIYILLYRVDVSVK